MSNVDTMRFMYSSYCMNEIRTTCAGVNFRKSQADASQGFRSGVTVPAMDSSTGNRV